MAPLRKVAFAMSGIREKHGVCHLLLSAAVESRRACQSSCREDDVVVLLDAGVMAMVDESTDSGFPCLVWVMEADLVARGVPMPTGAGKASGAVGLTNESRVLEIIESCAQTLSWR